ncbi:MAG: right-handed parallel beta-helix repeat-containing protein, partial [Candidatus Delongbacteria bacterium]|nr:right-handed parallel beta-helix repeat-containing protein [Candidatus Delongbacteria bacterium]
MKIKQIIILTLLTIAFQVYSANPRRYITHDGSGLRDGSSWENAGGAEELEDIIDSIQDADFWIAKGTYKPSRNVSDPEDERDMTFLPNHNNIYGGFAGYETDLSQRDIKNNETIFSGDIGIEGDNSDNCYHVMRAVPILDGVTVRDGNANGHVNPNAYGGGVYVWGYDSVFRNCTFRDNYASQQGGAVFMDSWGYDVTFENCLFYNNETNYGGGGAILCYRENTLIINCTFVKNRVNVSGIVSFTGNITGLKMTNNIFWQNTGNAIQYDNYYYGGYIFHNAIEGGYAGITNINLSPSNAGDANSPYFTDPDHHDYSLQSLSPCIDAGVYWNVSCETDITGSLRPQGSGWDIGAYEYNNGPLTAVLPSVSTLSPEFTTVSTARVRGIVTDDGGAQMITKGVYYSTTP